MTAFLLTYSNGVEVTVEAATMEDDGISTKLFREDGSLALQATDCEIVCCEPVGAAPATFDVEETKHGVVLKNDAGVTIAAYRNHK